jgi:hypothetical protein
MESARELDLLDRCSFEHQSPKERREILEFFLEASSSHTSHNEPHQELESIQKSLLIDEFELRPCTSHDSSREPSPEPRTPKEEEIQPLEFAHVFEDDSSRDITNTSNHYKHKNLMASIDLYEVLDEVWNHGTIVDWSPQKSEPTSEAIRVSSISMTIHCSMRGNTVDAVHDPTARACIIPKVLLDTLVGDMPLTPTDRCFRSFEWNYLFPCRGIARDMLIIIDKIEVCLDFHIYDIMDFDPLLGFPLDELLDKSQGSIDHKLRESDFATSITGPGPALANPCPKKDPLKERVHVSSFVSSESVLIEVVGFLTPHENDSEDSLHFCEGERSSSPRPSLSLFSLARILLLSIMFKSRF